MPKTNLRHQILIDALTSKLWKVLTEREYLEQWMNLSFEGVWVPGKEIFFSGETSHSGIVNDVVPGMLLSYAILHESFKENVQFEIIPDPGGLELKYFCSGFTDTEEEYLLRLQNTGLQLQKIKWLAEFG